MCVLDERGGGESDFSLLFLSSHYWYQRRPREINEKKKRRKVDERELDILKKKKNKKNVKSRNPAYLLRCERLDQILNRKRAYTHK